MQGTDWIQHVYAPLQFGCSGNQKLRRHARQRRAPRQFTNWDFRFVTSIAWSRTFRFSFLLWVYSWWIWFWAEFNLGSKGVGGRPTICAGFQISREVDFLSTYNLSRFSRASPRSVKYMIPWGEEGVGSPKLFSSPQNKASLPVLFPAAKYPFSYCVYM